MKRCQYRSRRVYIRSAFWAQRWGKQTSNGRNNYNCCIQPQTETGWSLSLLPKFHSNQSLTYWVMVLTFRNNNTRKREHRPASSKCENRITPNVDLPRLDFINFSPGPSTTAIQLLLKFFLIVALFQQNRLGTLNSLFFGFPEFSSCTVIYLSFYC